MYDEYMNDKMTLLTDTGIHCVLQNSWKSQPDYGAVSLF